MQQPWVIAHRGASGHAPENTLAAFRRAAALGAQFIETDVHLTRDAHLVLIHDHTLERTTNGRGEIRLHTLAELRALDAGAWFGAAFAGERIPTLEEALEFGRQADVLFYLELKADAIWGAEHALANALRRSGEAARTVVLSFLDHSLAAMNRLEPACLTGYLFDRWSDDAIDRALHAGARQLAPREESVTPERVERAHHAGLPVVAWTVNEPARMRALVAAGVDGIMTDFPDRLRTVLDS